MAKMSQKFHLELELLWNWMATDLEAPLVIEAVPRFTADVEALGRLCEGKKPPLRSIRCQKSGTFFTDLRTRWARRLGEVFRSWMR